MWVLAGCCRIIFSKCRWTLHGVALLLIREMGICGQVHRIKLSSYFSHKTGRQLSSVGAFPEWMGSSSSALAGGPMWSVQRCGAIPCCGWPAWIGRKGLGGRFGLWRRSFLDWEFNWWWCVPLENLAGSALRRAQGTQLFNHPFKQLGYSLQALCRLSACTHSLQTSRLFYWVRDS